MIDLAPNHKQGLVAPSPLLLAGGVIGSGDALPRGLDPTALGAIVIGPLTEHSRAGAPAPRLAEFPGGFVLETGGQNRGVDATLRHYERLWLRLGCAVVIQLADSHPRALANSAGRLAASPGVQGFELLLPRSADGDLTRRLVTTLTRASDLPVWVKLPLQTAALLAPVATLAGAVGLVVAQPPLGSVRRTMINGRAQWVTGSIFGPSLFPQILTALLDVAQLGLSAVLIAAGGVHTHDQVDQALAAGAQAVQIDSLAWIEPGLVTELAARVAIGGPANARQAG